MRHNRILELEVLRAAAILLVLVGHSHAMIWWRQPLYENLSFAYGVDLFFCVSGFVITSAFYQPLKDSSEIDGPQRWNAVAAFWIRRAYRIIPLAWLWLAIPLVLSIVFNKSGYFGSPLGNVGDGISAILNVYNFHLDHCVDSHAIFCGGNGVYWSLSLEEQFYLVFPFLVFLPKRVMIFALFAAIGWMMTRGYNTTLVFMTRIDAICLGVLIAFFKMSDAYRSFTPVILRHSLARAVATIILIGTILIAPAPGALVSMYPALVTAACGALVVIASYDQGYLMQDGIIRSALVWVGERSFALYLIHNPIYSFVHETCDRLYPGGLPNRSVKIAVTVVILACLLSISDLLYRYFETPLRKRGAKVANEWAKSGPTVTADPQNVMPTTLFRLRSVLRLW